LINCLQQSTSDARWQVGMIEIINHCSLCHTRRHFSET